MPDNKISNEQVAREVMRFEVVIIDFLTDHNAAMMVVEKMREDGWLITVFNTDPEGYEVLFETSSGSSSWGGDKSLCVAICEAALKAVRS